MGIISTDTFTPQADRNKPHSETSACIEKLDNFQIFITLFRVAYFQAFLIYKKNAKKLFCTISTQEDIQHRLLQELLCTAGSRVEQPKLQRGPTTA